MIHKKTSYQIGLWIFIFIASSLATYFFWNAYDQPLYGIDDANIYFVYMRNLAKGHGLVYNIGGEHVEGFTSLLWVLIGSVFYLFVDHPETGLLILNIIILTFTIWKVCLFVDGYLQDKRMITPYTIIVTGFLLLIPGYVDWTTLSLMETGLWSMLLVFLFTGIFEQYLNERPRYTFTNVLLLLIVITRPESFLWGGLAIMIQTWLIFIKTRSFKATIQPTLISSLVFITSIGLLTAFRLYYFGYPLPNTYYAKVSADRYANIKDGLGYITNFRHYYIPHFILPIVCVVITLFFYTFRRKRSLILWAGALLVLATYFIPLVTGGDHFGMFRFMQPCIPLFVLFYVITWFNAYSLKKWIWYIPTTLLLIVIMFSCRVNYFNLTEVGCNMKVEFIIANQERTEVARLNEFFKYQKSYPTYGVHVAGASAYTYKGITIDLLGLNNPEMAHATKIKTGIKNHSSFNKSVFYNQQPDLFFFTRVYADTSAYYADPKILQERKQWGRDVYRDILSEKKFKSMYTPVFILGKNEPGIVQTYASNRFLAELDTTAYSYIVMQRIF